MIENRAGPPSGSEENRAADVGVRQPFGVPILGSNFDLHLEKLAQILPPNQEELKTPPSHHKALLRLLQRAVAGTAAGKPGSGQAQGVDSVERPGL